MSYYTAVRSQETYCLYQWPAAVGHRKCMAYSERDRTISHGMNEGCDGSTHRTRLTVFVASFVTGVVADTANFPEHPTRSLDCQKSPMSYSVGRTSVRKLEEPWRKNAGPLSDDPRPSSSGSSHASQPRPWRGSSHASSLHTWPRASPEAPSNSLPSPLPRESSGDSTSSSLSSPSHPLPQESQSTTPATSPSLSPPSPSTTLHPQPLGRKPSRLLTTAPQEGQVIMLGRSVNPQSVFQRHKNLDYYGNQPEGHPWIVLEIDGDFVLCAQCTSLDNKPWASRCQSWQWAKHYIPIGHNDHWDQKNWRLELESGSFNHNTWANLETPVIIEWRYCEPLSASKNNPVLHSKSVERLQREIAAWDQPAGQHQDPWKVRRWLRDNMPHLRVCKWATGPFGGDHQKWPRRPSHKTVDEKPHRWSRDSSGTSLTQKVNEHSSIEVDKWRKHVANVFSSKEESDNSSHIVDEVPRKEPCDTEGASLAKRPTDPSRTSPTTYFSGSAGVSSSEVVDEESRERPCVGPRDTGGVSPAIYSTDEFPSLLTKKSNDSGSDWPAKWVDKQPREAMDTSRPNTPGALLPKKRLRPLRKRVA
ncbi:hypothetical protein K461DRAFT_267684 [Myriangium duriaei CBS 260.36]|uniref:Uncharacterized protein n=1 Tax=Myriangium duriaei CBS 260.36 TaxID=1168546 RepID=A0A9P4J0N7_9PEZI|nr:hypothetical protein K461DRAFT_267684 [Myriangium duriaei CBS 260.36]